MRISTLQIFQQGIEAFGRQQTKLSHLQQQISTGVRITKPSDDPAASSRVLELQQTVTLLEQYNVNITLAENRLKFEESSVSALETAYFRLKELSIQASGLANEVSALNAIAVEVDELNNQLLGLANATDSSGDFLFAGFQNQSQPFTQTLTGSVQHVVYSGDQGQRSFQVSQTRQIVSDNSGSEVFLQLPSAMALNESTDPANGGSAVMAPANVSDASVYVPGDYRIVFTAPGVYDVVDLSGPVNIVTGATYTDSTDIEFNGIRTSITGTPVAGDNFTISQGQYKDIFSVVSGMADTLRSSTDTQRLANLQQAQVDMETFFSNVLDIRTSIGGKLNALEVQYDDNTAFSITTQASISTLRDTDLAQAISQLTVEQTTLDAAQAVFAKISSSSLFNFLR